ncbi:MAG: SMC-Scp complex subunit ScpB, partial [Christensenellaceae bacterium]
MESLTNTIEAILFASGNAVPLALITEKLGITKKQTDAAIEELKARYSDESGLLLLLFNGKAQLSTNPIYKDAVSAVL